MPFSRMVIWMSIAFLLTFGAGAYWFFTREFKGQAAETVNIAHTEALTGSSLGLVGYWTFDGNDVKWSDTTTEIKDTSGNSKHGDAQGSLTTTSATAGKTGQALSFNGSSDIVSLGNVYNGVKTIAFWAKPNSTTQPFIDLNGTATINMTTGTVAANSFTSPTIYVDGTATSTFPDTNWHHIVVTTGTGINASAVNLGKIASSYFGGILDDVRFYSSTLSSTQVTDLYRASSAKEVDNANHREALTNGLVGYWTFDGRDVKWSDVGTEIKDISGNGNHGAVSGLSASSAVRGKLGQALSFNGSGDAIQVPGPVLTNTFSVTFWISPESNATSHKAILIDSGGYYGILYNVGSSSYCNFSTTIDLYNGVSHCADTSLQYNEWQHVAIVNNAGSVSFYYNGLPDGTDSITYSPTILLIGDNYNGDSLKGKLDDVRVYNRALSASEIANLYSIWK